MGLKVSLRVLLLLLADWGVERTPTCESASDGARLAVEAGRACLAAGKSEQRS